MSGTDIKIYSSLKPGYYKVGGAYTVEYTAVDKYGNSATCEFTFKVSGEFQRKGSCITISCTKSIQLTGEGAYYLKLLVHESYINSW